MRKSVHAFRMTTPVFPLVLTEGYAVCNLGRNVGQPQRYRRGHGHPSNKQRDKTTRTSALTEITPYKWLVDYDIPGVDGLALHHLYRAMALVGRGTPGRSTGRGHALCPAHGQGPDRGASI